MNNREWLYGMEPSNLAAWFDAEHVEPNDGIKPESVVRADSMDANDSREKLEDDVGFIVKEGFVTYKSIIGWLDRQAAITANETSHDSPYVGLVRGKQWERTEISDYYCGRCGWKVTDHDSYCPECGGALHKASNKPDSKFDARKTAESGEIRASKDDIRDFDDSREKLEADVRKHYSHTTSTLMYPPSANKQTDWLAPMPMDTVFGWLDRQEAITEEQTRYKWVTASAYEIAELKRERDDLKAQIDEILAGDKATDAINAELVAKVADLERECDDLHSRIEQWMNAAGNAHDMWEKADARRVEAERRASALSEKLSRAYGNAHNTLRMMDEELA